MSRNQRPKIDAYPDYLFIVLHFPVFDKQVGRLNAGELDLFVGPDFVITLPEPAAEADRVPVRALPHQRGDPRAVFSKGSGYLLYQIVDQSFDYCFPMLRKIGNKLEQLEEDIFSGRGEEIVRDISNVKQEIINFRKIIRPAANGAARPRAHQAALLGRGAGDLLRRHRRRLGAHLGHARELQGGGRGARGHQRVRDLAPGQRHPAGPDRVQRRGAAADLHRQPLGHERRRARARASIAAFWIIVGAMARCWSG